MTKFFHINHGLDNIDEIINLNELTFVRLIWTMLNPKDGWKVQAILKFRNLQEETIHLGENGAQDLIKILVEHGQTKT